MKDKGTATNRKGTGSTYGGTQTPDPTAPDGYQSPSAKDKSKGGTKKPVSDDELGAAYDTPTSYGDKNKPANKSTGREGDENEIAEGSPVR